MVQIHIYTHTHNGLWFYFCCMCVNIKRENQTSGAFFNEYWVSINSFYCLLLFHQIEWKFLSHFSWIFFLLDYFHFIEWHRSRRRKIRRKIFIYILYDKFTFNCEIYLLDIYLCFGVRWGGMKRGILLG